MKRVLFVDDDSNLLNGLRRLLRPHRKTLEMEFAQGGEEAVRSLKQARFDVIVTDMRMPGIDGAQLLEYVHAHYPDTMRIVLSGQFDLDSGMRAVRVAHQFLAKPCSPQNLLAAIERCARPGAFLPDAATRRVVSSVGVLPSPSKTCEDLSAALDDPQTSMADIAGIIDRDVALAAKVMQLVNSAFFNLPRKMTDVAAALSILGLDLLRQLVLSAEILERFKPAQPVPWFSFAQFEAHSKLASTIAGIIPAQREMAQYRAICGLLHDAGKLVFAARMPADFHKAYRHATERQVPLHEAETAVFGTSHAETGAYLLNLWGLPDPVVHAIAVHHKPLPLSSPPIDPQALPLPLLLHVADALAHEITPARGAHAAGPAPTRLDPRIAECPALAEPLEEWRAAARQLPNTCG